VILLPWGDLKNVKGDHKKLEENPIRVNIFLCKLHDHDMHEIM